MKSYAKEWLMGLELSSMHRYSGRKLGFLQFPLGSAYGKYKCDLFTGNL